MTPEERKSSGIWGNETWSNYSQRPLQPKPFVLV
jgi:hypothetical protein